MKLKYANAELYALFYLNYHVLIVYLTTNICRNELEQLIAECW